MALYQRPTAPSGSKVVNLVPDALGGEELTPKTRVLCINRGDTVYRDKYDGRDYTCQPGLFEVAYEVAVHFRDRSIVPGTRDPETGRSEHYIAILGVDPSDRCEPLTAAETSEASTKVEALDRSLMTGADRDVVVIPTQAARARTAGGSRRVRQAVETNDGKGTADPDVMRAPEGGDAMRQIASDSAGRAAEQDE